VDESSRYVSILDCINSSSFPSLADLGDPLPYSNFAYSLSKIFVCRVLFKARTRCFHMLLDSTTAWNIRGAHLQIKQNEIKHSIQSHQIQMTGILETKLNDSLAKSAVTYINREWLYDDNLAYGRIFTTWNPLICNVTSIFKHTQFIHFQVYHIPSTLNFDTFIYSFNQPSSK